MKISLSGTRAELDAFLPVLVPALAPTLPALAAVESLTVNGALGLKNPAGERAKVEYEVEIAPGP